MNKYVCDPCGYIYDPEIGDPDSGIAPGTAFEDIPEDWVCPVCGVDKSFFSLTDQYRKAGFAEPAFLLLLCRSCAIMLLVFYFL